MKNFDFISFIIGLLLGMIVMLILVWIAYYTRTFLFTYCPTQAPACSGTDYYNNPGEALSNGAKINNVLFLDKDKKLYYKRMQKSIDCIPEWNQTVNVIYPQYCEFTDKEGKRETYKSISYGANIYKGTTSGNKDVIITKGNCIPDSEKFNNGEPLLQWDPVPLLN